MEGAPKFTPKSEGPENSNTREVEQLAVVAEALKADMLKRGGLAEHPLESSSSALEAGFEAEESDIVHFDAGESMLDEEGQKALRETLTGMQLLPKEDLSS